MGFLFIMPLTAQEQYIIQFSYDTAGNQTLRDRVCINCNASKAVIDSTLVDKPDSNNDPLESSKTDNNINAGSVITYPNPVTNLLSVEWIHEEKQVSGIVLFSGIGRQLYRKVIQSSEGTLDIDFQSYPSGHYTLYVQYADNTKKTFHIIKK